MYESRNFIIFSVEEIDKVDFSTVLESSPETLRRSTNGTKTFVKWDQAQFDPAPYTIVNAETGLQEVITPQESTPPSFIDNLETREGPYTYEEMLSILSGPEWTTPMPKGGE
jgi:hypothetical protein